MRLRLTSDSVLRDRAAQLSALSAGRARSVMARAVNHTGNKARTAVRRALVKQTSAPRKAVVAGVTSQKAATRGLGHVAYTISAKPQPLPLKLFRPRQDRLGVKARVWGRQKRYGSAFIVQSLSGHVFRRAGQSRLPIRRLHGPSMATELVKDESRRAFQRVSRDLPKRVDHELGRVLR